MLSEERKRRRIEKKKKRILKFTRIWALIYLVLLLIFEIALIAMDVIPFKIMFPIMIILGILSVLLFVQLFFPRVKNWARGSAMILSTILMVIFMVGTSYAFGTMSFLNTISSDVHNENSVNVSRKPFNVLITGYDTFGPIDMEGRSDVNMLVTVNPKTHEILLTSIPRDYEVQLANYDYATDKLTHTGFYSVDDTITAVEDLLDIKINYYVKVNFTTVVKFIDAIGGVDVYSENAFSTSIYTPSGGKEYFDVEEGMNHFDGAEALGFARERSAFGDGDNTRVKNQQAVFQAILEKAMKSSTLVMKYGELLDGLKDYMEMNMSSRETRALIKLQLRDNPDWNITRNSVEGHDASMVTYTGGSDPVYVMAQDEESLLKAHNMIYKVMGLEVEEPVEDEDADAESSEPTDDI